MEFSQKVLQEFLSSREMMADAGLEDMYDYLEQLVLEVFQKIDIEKLESIIVDWEKANDVVESSQYEIIVLTAWEYEMGIMYGDDYLLYIKEEAVHAYPDIVRRVNKIGADVYQSRNTPFCPSTDISLNCEKCQINEFCKIKKEKKVC